mgnify:CR=1 FL=1
MDNKAWFIIVNPSSGGGISNARLEQISRCLKQNNLLGNVYKTSIDKNAERIRLQKELEKAEKVARQTEKNLENQSFIEKAPAKVVEEMRARLENSASAIVKLQAQIVKL